jgi:hypothetical protein
MTQQGHGAPCPCRFQPHPAPTHRHVDTRNDDQDDLIAVQADGGSGATYGVDITIPPPLRDSKSSQ